MGKSHSHLESDKEEEECVVYERVHVGRWPAPCAQARAASYPSGASPSTSKQPSLINLTIGDALPRPAADNTRDPLYPVPTDADTYSGASVTSRCSSWSLGDFTIGRPLGKSKYGLILMAKSRHSGYVVNLRLLSKHLIKTNRTGKLFKREIELFSQLKHQNIRHQYGYYNDAKNISVIQEYVDGECLLRVLKKCRHFNDVTASGYVSQVVDALIQFHFQGAYDRDIRPEIIFIDRTGKLKVADFGCGIWFPSLLPVRKICYMSPDQLAGKELDANVDLWHLGILTFELLVGRPPFLSRRRQEICRLICAMDLKFPDFVSKQAVDFILRLLCQDPGHRLALAEVKEHPWLTQISNAEDRVVCSGGLIDAAQSTSACGGGATA